MFCSQPILFFIFISTYPSLTNGFHFIHENHRTGRSDSSDPSNGINYNPNGSSFLWLPEDTYAGETFFRCVVSYYSSTQVWTHCVLYSGFDFWNASDPTQ